MFTKTTFAKTGVTSTVFTKTILTRFTLTFAHILLIQNYLKLKKKLKVEIDLTKSDIDKLRRIIGLKTQTRADVVLRSFVKMMINDPDAIEIIQYEQQRS